MTVEIKEEELARQWMTVEIKEEELVRKWFIIKTSAIYIFSI